MGTICPPDHGHGSSGNCYNNHGCRCEPCTVHHCEYGFYRRHMTKAGRPLNGRVDATGTRRRLQALIALGWNQSQIGAAIGIDERLMHRLMNKQQVTRSTRDRIAAVYERMSATLPPETTAISRRSVTLSKARARRNGWVPPLAWDDIDNDERPAIVEHVAYATQVDTVAVDLALKGSRAVRLTPAERRICVQQLHSRRWSDKAIATLIGCDEKTVARIRDELNLAPWDDAAQLTTRADLAA